MLQKIIKCQFVILLFLCNEKVASLIKEGDTIFIDPFSSCSFFVKELFHIKGITIITNNVEVLSFLSQSSIDVICSGGIQTSPNRYALVGHIAEKPFRNIHADWAVFSASFPADDGLIYNMYYNEIILSKVMPKNAEKKLFLCDSSKLGTNSTYYQCSLADIDYIVCDSKEIKGYQQEYPNLKII